MLTLAEEVLLLAHDEQSGRFLDLPDMLLHTALAGAALMELALLGRIDTDLAELILVDATPTSEPLLDRPLARIAAEPHRRSTAYWLDRLRANGPQIRAAALERLIERGILRCQDDRVLWVFETRRYPLVNGRQQQEVRLRIAHLLLSDDIPDPRDTMIVALAEACGLLRRVFSEEELRRSQDRIRQIIRLDLIGRAVSSAIEDLQALVLRMAGYSGIVARDRCPIARYAAYGLPSLGLVVISKPVAVAHMAAVLKTGDAAGESWRRRRAVASTTREKSSAVRSLALCSPGPARPGKRGVRLSPWRSAASARRDHP